MKRLNWPIWIGFLISVFAFISYPFLFINWPITRDFPWANLGLFLIAAALMFFGVVKAFRPDRRLISKIAAAILAMLSVLVLGSFIFVAFIAARWLPASQGAPQVGQKAPEFLLTDANDKPISLASLLSQPIDGKSPRGILLIFYRGYW